jgi:hypothetical protein
MENNQMTNFQAIFAPLSTPHFRKELSDDDLLTFAAKVADRMDDDDDDDAQSKGLTQHEIATFADMVVETSGGTWTRPQALHFVMHSPRGNAMVHRLRGAVGKALAKKKEQKMQPETFEEMCKSMGIERIAAAVVKRGHSSAISEVEFTSAVTALAQKRHPTLRPDVAFSKLFGEQSEQAATLRRAYAIIKNFPMMSVVEKGKATIMPTANDGDDSVNDPTDALEQLEALVARLRASARGCQKLPLSRRSIKTPRMRILRRRNAAKHVRGWADPCFSCRLVHGGRRGRCGPWEEACPPRTLSDSRTDGFRRPSVRPNLR